MCEFSDLLEHLRLKSCIKSKGVKRGRHGVGEITFDSNKKEL